MCMELWRKLSVGVKKGERKVIPELTNEREGGNERDGV